jgi:hypothetical protein
MKPIAIVLQAFVVMLVALSMVSCSESSKPDQPPNQSLNSGVNQSTTPSMAKGMPPPPPPAPPSRPVPPKVKHPPQSDKQTTPTIVGFMTPPAARNPKKVKKSEEKPNAKEIMPVIQKDLTPRLAKVVVDIRLAMAHRDLDAVEKYMKTAKDEARTEADRAELDRLETIHDQLVQFWDGIQASISKLQAAEELVIKDKRIVVVESGKDYLSVKVEGTVHRFRLKTMPTSLVMALVDRYFGKDTGSLAIIGAFLAVDPKGDRSKAGRYWREAAEDGIDTEKLLPELEFMPPVAQRNGSED